MIIQLKFCIVLLLASKIAYLRGYRHRSGDGLMSFKDSKTATGVQNATMTNCFMPGSGFRTADLDSPRDISAASILPSRIWQIEVSTETSRASKRFLQCKASISQYMKMREILGGRRWCLLILWPESLKHTSCVKPF